MPTVVQVKNAIAASLSFLVAFSAVISPPDAAAKNGNVGAYTKKSAGVTVKRNANGTIEVTDEETVYAPHTSPGFRSGKKRGSVGSYVRKSAASTVKRNADGTVEVTDTSATTRRATSSSASNPKKSITKKSSSSKK